MPLKVQDTLILHAQTSDTGTGMYITVYCLLLDPDRVSATTQHVKLFTWWSNIHEAHPTPYDCTKTTHKLHRRSLACGGIRFTPESIEVGPYLLETVRCLFKNIVFALFLESKIKQCFCL